MSVYTNQEGDREQFSTKDFTTIVLMKYFDIKFDRVVTENQGRTKRVFISNEERDTFENLLLQYENNTLDVKAKDFVKAIDDTKDFVHR